VTEKKPDIKSIN